MEEVGNGVDGRLYHGDQAAHHDVAGEQIGNGEGDREMSQRESQRLDKGPVSIRAMIVQE